MAVDQQVDVVVEEREVVVRLLDASDRRRHHEHPGAGLARNRLRRLQVEVGFDQDDLHLLRLHRLLEGQRVRGGRRNTGLGLDVAHDVEAERVGEVGPRPVVGDDLHSLVRRHRGLPALLRRREPAVEVRVPLCEVRAVGGVHLSQLVLDRLGDPPAVARVEPVVRIALRVHVPHGARDLARRDVEDLRRQRRIEVAGASRLDLRVAALRDERRQPADLEFPPHDDQQVGGMELQHEARLRFDEVWILVALRQRLGRHLVPADVTGNRGEVLGGRDDLRLGRRVTGGGGQQRGRRERGEQVSYHGMTLRRHARRARRWKTGTGRAPRSRSPLPRSSCAGTARAPG